MSYNKYRWFYTSSKTLVLGGKNAEQNDMLLKEYKDKDYVVMHTSHPGSPFSIIIKDRAKITAKDIEEASYFTGCFSKAWKEGKKTTSVDIFTMSQLSKDKDMKAGSWRVVGKVQRVSVPLRLALTKQRGVLRAVPPSSTTKVIMIVLPGPIDKTEMAPKFEVELENGVNHEELMAALPAGGIRRE